VSSARNKPSSVRRVGTASRHRRQRGGIIYLGPTLLPASSSLPGTQTVRATPRPLFGLAPGGVCHATPVTSGPVRSYRTLSPLPVRPARTRSAIGGLLSAALSVALRRPGVTRHPALRSSDFPPAVPESPASDPYSHASHGQEIRPSGPDCFRSMRTSKATKGAPWRKGNGPFVLVPRNTLGPDSGRALLLSHPSPR